MFGIDKLKLVMDVENVEIIREDVFVKKVLDDEIVGLSFQQEYPFSLKIKIDYCKSEAVIEFSGKVLLSEYHNLIRLQNIHKCFDNIHSLGICKINHYLSADVPKIDATIDANNPYHKGLTEFITCNLSSNNKYIARHLPNGNFIVEKNVTSKQCKKRLTIYNKYLEMDKANNRKYLKDYYGDENPFVHKNWRFELNLNSKEQIRTSLGIRNTKLIDVLLSAQRCNPICDFLSEIIDEESTPVIEEGKIKDYHMSLVLKDCDYDIKKVEARVRQYYSKGTKMRAVLKPYKQMLSAMSDRMGGCSRDRILNLVRTETQITPKMILELR